MARRITWTDAALIDLDQIAEYIARDSRVYSATFVRKALKAARSLSEFSNRGPMVPEFDRATIRQIYVYRYRLIYHVTDQEVSVLALIHGARDLESLWAREERELPEE